MIYKPISPIANPCCNRFGFGVVLGLGAAMRRRDFIKGIAGSAAGWPLPARAQQGDRVRRIGVLISAAPDDPETTARVAAFPEKLKQLGWSKDHNVQIDFRFASGISNQYRPLAQELIALHPDVLVAASTPVIAVLQRETQIVPIVFTNVSDPIGAGFVASLNRPGGNITGVLLYEGGIAGKWLAMLKEISPSLKRVALLGNPKTTPFEYFRRAAEDAALSLAIELAPTPIENEPADLERAVVSFATAPHGALLVLPDPTIGALRERIIPLVAQLQLPAVYPFRSLVDAGGLMSYGVDPTDVIRIAATYVDRILRGAKPAQLPVQAPVKYETIINLRTAKSLGLNVPESLLVRADEVIE
jgi:putative ABC transport system substrate-binding protein